MLMSQMSHEKYACNFPNYINVIDEYSYESGDVNAVYFLEILKNCNYVEW